MLGRWGGARGQLIMDGAAEVKPPLGAVREDWLKVAVAVAVEGRGGAGGGEVGDGDGEGGGGRGRKWEQQSGADELAVL
jgi:hypothetical protein